MSVARFPLIEVAGSSYQMGYQHGRQAAGLVQRYLAWIEELTGVARNELSQRARDFLRPIIALSPSLADEVKGLADGAGIGLAEAVLCQARGDAAHASAGACTAFAVKGAATADRRLLAGQNLDLEQGYADVTIVLRVNPDDGRAAALMLTFAGQLGYPGMNSHGVALFNNSLFDFEYQLALPRQPLKRCVLEQPDAATAVELVQRHRVSSAANMLLCDGAGEVADIEIRPQGTAVFESEHPDCLVHTNHYRSEVFSQHETGSVPDSRPRLTRMNELIQERWGQITVETMKEILADHRLEGAEESPAGICRHGAGGWHSIAGLIAEPAERRLHIRRGYGCSGTWTAYEV